jgi:preprotein translocase subunit SecD
MLYISKWKATAILLTALICCLFAVPNLFPENMVKRWPAWAQRHIVLGLDLQGGSHILLEVDVNDVRRQKLLALQDDVRRVLREARIGLTRAPVIRGNAVEVVIRESDLQQGVAKLRELSQPLGGFLGSTGARSIDVDNVGGGVVRLSPTEPALLERVRQVVDQSVEIIGKRVNQLGLVEPSIQRQGNDRILVQVPGLGDPQQLLEILGKTAKLTFRLVDTSVPIEQALQGRPPPEAEIVYGSKAENRQRADRHVQVQHLRRPQICAGHAGERRPAVCDRAR